MTRVWSETIRHAKICRPGLHSPRLEIGPYTVFRDGFIGLLGGLEDFFNVCSARRIVMLQRGLIKR